MKILHSRFAIYVLEWLYIYILYIYILNGVGIDRSTIQTWCWFFNIFILYSYLFTKKYAMIFFNLPEIFKWKHYIEESQFMFKNFNLFMLEIVVFALSNCLTLLAKKFATKFLSCNFNEQFLQKLWASFWMQLESADSQFRGGFDL